VAVSTKNKKNKNKKKGKKEKQTLSNLKSHDMRVPTMT
jgi:hypothetical protein